jgi:hypothetical protein
MVHQDVEPTSYTEAATHPYWQEAMQSKWAVLEANNIGSLTFFHLVSNLLVFVGFTK